MDATIMVTNLKQNIVMCSNTAISLYIYDNNYVEIYIYLDTWSGFEAAKTAPWPSRGLHHCGKFLEPPDE